MTNKEKIANIGDNLFTDIVRKSGSLRGIMRKIGVKESRHVREEIKRRIAILNIQLASASPNEIVGEKSLPGEEWRIMQYREKSFGNILVSNYGRVFSKLEEHLIKPVISPNGYYQFATTFPGEKRRVPFKVHRCVAYTFLERIDGKDLVNHIDANKLNNKLENLEWCSAKENYWHARNCGLLDENIRILKEADLQARRFSDDEIRFIRENVKERDSEFGYRALARKFGVNKSTIRDIVNRKRYKDVG